jgi:hypothetical protein
MIGPKHKFGKGLTYSDVTEATGIEVAPDVLQNFWEYLTAILSRKEGTF